MSKSPSTPKPRVLEKVVKIKTPIVKARAKQVSVKRPVTRSCNCGGGLK
ncbi:hypothetical protein AWB76_03277 [Caballeronia temeraria]|uniref:Uncharacterized protein n=1 Tax=Caballeronia temeraria TaxID=1777137 RepID=A0A158AXL6_9BURK|nr:hypothetical protein [Caballeronia temeraria]SAK62604.1 hypothetical protein AWB76_03277 [Caballeronia temeraria]